MTATTSEYELVLMLDPEAPEERREQIASEARNRIESGGTLKHDTAWGMRKLAYEIRQRTEADYRFFRFETEGGILADLDHNLRIADGVLRFRIFEVDPSSPAVVPPAPLAAGQGASGRGQRREGSRGRDGRDGSPPEASDAPAPAGEREASAPATGQRAERSPEPPDGPSPPPAGEEPAN